MAVSLATGLSVAGGNIVIGSACGLVMATALLNIGWLFLNTVGEGRETLALTKAVTRMSDMNESE